jgi:membrane fusion protein, multidrug efflux system
LVSLKAWRAWPALVVALVACNRNAAAPPSTPPDPPAVAVSPARATSVPMFVELPGRTNPYRVAQVRARVDGIVLKRDFKEGADVKAGQRLYQIDPGPYQAALANAQATLGRARANVGAVNAQAARYKQLVVTRAVSQQEYDNAIASLGQALADVASGQAQVRTASINLGYTDVTAPITGRAGISQVTEGAYVQASQATLMTTIQQTDPMYVDLNQSSVEGLRLRRDITSGKVRTGGPHGARVDIMLEDGTQYALPGRLEFTDITVDPGTGSVTLRVIVPNPDHLLLPGMFVRARVEEGTVQDAVLVPQIGVSHTPQGQAAVLLVGPDGKVVQRTVQATRTLGSDWIVTGGLQAGEKVIVSGLQRVHPGMAVNVVQGAPRQAAARR